MTKRTAILAMSLLVPIWAFSQDISINLSIHWKRSPNIFVKDSISTYPLLIVTYSNLSENKYYFKKVADSKLGFPRTYKGTEMYFPEGRPNLEYLAKTHSDYSDKKMMVCLNHWHQSWTSFVEVFEESTYECIIKKKDENTEYCIDQINDELTNIYNYLIRRKLDKSEINDNFLSNSQAKRMMDSMSVVIKENKDRFVFLEPFETQTDTIDLSAFSECGGEYHFELLSDGLSRFLPVYSKAKQDFVDKPMPNLIDGYKLYHGAVFTNKVSLKLVSAKTK